MFGKIDNTFYAKLGSTKVEVWESIDDKFIPQGIGPVYFSTKNVSNDRWVMVTSRDESVYREHFPELTQENSGKVMVIGAGLGGFIRDIVADVVNYEEVKTLLNTAIDELGGKIDKNVFNRLLELKRRVEIITDPEKVLLINSLVEEIPQCHPELEGQIARVVDLCGATLYNDNGNNINEAIDFVLEPEGERFISLV
mgnify:CR=1 FL=1